MDIRLIGCLGDEVFRIHDCIYSDVVPGVCIAEWMGLFYNDYDDVDRLYIDHETMGA